MDEKFINLAIKETQKSQEQVGCGVVIVKDGKVIAKSCNKQRALYDATAHAEILAIRQAGRKLQNKNLTDCVIYCSCEPCIMCFCSIVFAKVKRLVYRTPLKEAFPDNIPVDIDIDYFLSKTDRKLEVTRNFNS